MLSFFGLWTMWTKVASWSVFGGGGGGGGGGEEVDNKS